jgi:FlaA1/EpsC-like NDP-sugar epimerase
MALLPPGDEEHRLSQHPSHLPILQSTLKQGFGFVLRRMRTVRGKEDKRMIQRLPVVIRNRFFLLSDLLLTALSPILAFALRLEIPLFWSYLPICIPFVFLAIAIKAPVYYLFGLYRRYWRYASVREILIIFGATLVSSAVLSFLVLVLFLPLHWFDRFPRSVLIIDWLLSLLFVGGARFSVRFLRELGTRRANDRHERATGRPRRVLIMGAGDTAALILHEMQANPGLGFVPVGLLDDHRAKIGMTIYGVPVGGSREDIPRLARDQQIDEVLIAMPSASGQAIRDVVTICQQAGVAYKTMPGLDELISGQVSVKQVREVRIEDLLRRAPVKIDGRNAEGLVAGSVVLVTGAGGSIGSELCRQVAQYQPQELLLLGHGENSIHQLMIELRERFPHLAARPLIADVRDRCRLLDILEKYQPQVVFHAAAHKHVPLMEANAVEAVKNNVFGTQSLLQAAEHNGVTRFVLVSTDKAVNPINIMGATKRVAELLVQDSARRTGRTYVVVRFGNVLGSRGSVVPLFQRQIAAGGPVTVTHPQMQRYFMTIPEAVQLIIQAATVGQGGEILVLDMGEPVRIVDLAADLIRLCGLEPGGDVRIAFTTPHPGEKLKEELFAHGEEPHPTQHPKILVARGNNTCDPETLARHLEELRALTSEGQTLRIHAKIQEIVPEYRPSILQPQASPGA